jgi:hypothetical protein
MLNYFSEKSQKRLTSDEGLFVLAYLTGKRNQLETFMRRREPAPSSGSDSKEKPRPSKGKEPAVELPKVRFVNIWNQKKAILSAELVGNEIIDALNRDGVSKTTPFPMRLRWDSARELLVAPELRMPEKRVEMDTQTSKKHRRADLSGECSELMSDWMQINGDPMDLSGFDQGRLLNRLAEKTQKKEAPDRVFSEREIKALKKLTENAKRLTPALIAEKFKDEVSQFVKNKEMARTILLDNCSRFPEYAERLLDGARDIDQFYGEIIDDVTGESVRWNQLDILIPNLFNVPDARVRAKACEHPYTWWLIQNRGQTVLDALKECKHQDVVDKVVVQLFENFGPQNIRQILSNPTWMDLCSLSAEGLERLLDGSHDFDQFYGEFYDGTTGVRGRWNRLDLLIPDLFYSPGARVRTKACEHPYTQRLIRNGSMALFDKAKECGYQDVFDKVLIHYADHLETANSRRILSDHGLVSAWFSSDHIEVQKALLQCARNKAHENNLIFHQFGPDTGSMMPFRYKVFACLAKSSHPQIVCGVLNSFRRLEDGLFYAGGKQTAPWVSMILGPIVQNRNEEVQNTLLIKIKSRRMNQIFGNLTTLEVLSECWNPAIGKAALEKVGLLSRLGKTYKKMNSNVKENQIRLARMEQVESPQLTRPPSRQPERSSGGLPARIELVAQSAANLRTLTSERPTTVRTHSF